MHTALPAVFVLILGQASPSAPPDDFQSYVDAGLRLYEENRFAEAAIEFEAAYALRPEPPLIYNAARCYEQIPDPKKAAEKYEEFLELSGTSAERRAKARRALSALRDEIGAKEAPPSPPPAAAQANVAATAPSPPPPTLVSAPAKPERSYVVETTLFALGAAGLAVGTTFAILAQNKADEVPLSLTTELQQEAEDDARSRALIADIGFGVAAAATAAGLIVLFTASDDEPAVSMSPALSADGAGFVIGGRL